jgi:antitoxin CptB
MQSRAVERLKWKSRRGLLELDIVLERFWARVGDEMNESDAATLERLLALPDNDLLDLVMGRADTSETRLRPMLRRLRTV